MITQLVWRPTDGGNVAVVTRARHWLGLALPRLVGRRPRGHLHDDTELLLCELVTNAVVHAGGVTAVQLCLTDETLRVTVCDHVAAPPVAQHAAPDADHGRGIALVETLATRWGVDRDRLAGKCVWLELSTAGAPV
ncbi:ATP-binding protein [Dactylosporangium sp. NBC_01737]|uniref:ATP-binding protein n=1 Tax=Dactylosporangium sp. NBC_01737 TaxID=2975959 RepID=UPI002E12AC9B|nr:ATP-binding protein [Dactylosporangium sp. NBC_01737]